MLASGATATSTTTNDGLRGTEAPMDVDRNNLHQPSIFASASASASVKSTSTATATATTQSSSTKQADSSSSFSSIFSSGTFKFELPNKPSPTLKSVDSFASLRFTTAPSDLSINDPVQGNGTDPALLASSSAAANPNMLADPNDSFYSDPPTPGLPEDAGPVCTPANLAHHAPQDHNHEHDHEDDHDDTSASIFDKTPLAGPARAVRRLSKGFARRFTGSGAAAAAEASAQLDSDDLAPSSPTVRVHALHPPRFSSRTITPKNVFTHTDDHLLPSPPAPIRPVAPPPPPPTETPATSSSSARPRPTPGTNQPQSNGHMPPPSSMPRPGRPGATPNTDARTHPGRTPSHTPSRPGNLNATLTPRGTPRHKRPRRDYDSDVDGAYTSGDDQYNDAGDNSVVYVGERFHGYGHQYMPPPPPMQHTPYGYPGHVPLMVNPFYPFATPQGHAPPPHMLYGPPPTQPQFGGAARPRHHMLHSEDDEDVYGGDADTSVTHASGSWTKPARARPATPFLVQSWVSAVKSLVVFVATAALALAAGYLLYQDFESKREAITTSMQVEMQACARKFAENHCGASAGRPPMLADACLQWEQCMAKDPHKGVFSGTVVAMFVSETAEAFLAGLSLRTLVFVGLVVAASVGVMRLSCGCCGLRRGAKGGARGRSKSRGRRMAREDVHSDGDEDDDNVYADKPRRRAAAAESSGSFGEPLAMGAVPLALMGPPASTTRPARYAPSPFHHQQQQPHSGMTPGGYYGGASVASTPGSSGIGLGRTGFARQQHETPSRMPGTGSLRRRR